MDNSGYKRIKNCIHIPIKKVKRTKKMRKRRNLDEFRKILVKFIQVKKSQNRM